MKNVHERVVKGSTDQVWALVATLATPGDRLWPRDVWPEMRLDHGLSVDSRGGHGMIRYFVESIKPGRSVVFRFESPTGLDGVHRFELEPTKDGTVLRHTIEATPRAAMRVMWPIAVRWVHDAVVEDAFDNAESHMNNRAVQRRRPNPYVRQVVRALVPHRPDRVGTLAGMGAAIMLGGIGTLHLVWALGSTFPFADVTTLARTVVGGDTFPSAAATATVAGLVATATAIVTARTYPRTRLGRLVPSVVARPGVVTVGAVLGLRGLVGLLVSALGVPATSSRFRTLDLVAYSPVCLALTIALWRLERKTDRTTAPR